MTDQIISWQTRELIRKEAEDARDEAVREMRNLLGVSSDSALEELREDVRYNRRKRKAEEARFHERNTGWIRTVVGSITGFLISAALAAATYFLNGGGRHP